MKILITGGSGFIGTNLIEYYAQNNEVLNLDIVPPRNHKHQKHWEECDICDYDGYRQLVNDFEPDYFIHMAARTDLREVKTIDGYSSNILGVENTIKIIGESKSIKRTLFASSRLVCKIGYQPTDDNDYNPPNLYGESKVIGEKLVKEISGKFEWIIVRPTSIWGEWFEIPYKTFFMTINKKKYVNISGYAPVKSFGYIGNSIHQLDKLMFSDKNMVCGKILYLCDYPPLNLNVWANQIRIEMKLSPIRTFPYFILRMGALLGDFLSYCGYSTVPITSFRLSNLLTDMEHETELLEKVCGKLPYSLKEGVKRTVNYLNFKNP